MDRHPLVGARERCDCLLFPISGRERLGERPVGTALRGWIVSEHPDRLTREQAARSQRWYHRSVLLEDLRYHLDLVDVGDDEYRALFMDRVRGFLEGAGPAAIGAIGGAVVPLVGALSEAWQFAVLAGAALALLLFRRGVVVTLVTAGLVGAVAGVAGAPLPS